MTSSSQPLYDDLWDFNQPEVSERRFEEKFAEIPHDNGEAHLQLLTQIARAQGLQRQFDEAHHTLDDVAAALADSASVARIRYWLERGRVLNSSGHPEMARPFFVDALAAAQAQGEDFYAVDAAHMLGIVTPPEEQLEWNMRAMQMAESSPSPYAQRWLGSLYNNIGWTHHNLGNYAEALRLFQQGVEWWQHRDPPQPDRLHVARWTVARTLRSLKRHTDALTILHDLEGANDGYVDEEIGENLLEQGDSARAAPFFAKAYQALSGDIWLQVNEAARLERLRALSQRPT